MKVHPAISMKTNGNENLPRGKADVSAQFRCEDSASSTGFHLLAPESSLLFSNLKVHPAISMKTNEENNLSGGQGGTGAPSAAAWGFCSKFGHLVILDAGREGK